MQTIISKHVGFTLQTLIDDDHTLAPPVQHPAVIFHPVTGEKILFVSPGYTKQILGLQAEDSIEVLKYIATCIEKKQSVITHKWQEGDVLIWDNRSLIHRSSTDPTFGKRTLYRIGICDQYKKYLLTPEKKGKKA